MSKRAIILAGGKGTRLHPYTIALPKPLIPLGEFPILEIVIRQLAHSGFDHITLALNHQADVIKAFFKDGARWGTYIDYSLETKPLGTMGPISLIKNLPEQFLVMNGDILTDLDFNDLYDKHKSKNSFITLAAVRREYKIDYGVLEVDESGRLCRFREKPKKSYDISMGIYILSKKVLGFIPTGIQYGFDELVGSLLEADVPIKVERYSGYWLDIGRPEDYLRAKGEFDVMKSKFLRI